MCVCVCVRVCVRACVCTRVFVRVCAACPACDDHFTFRCLGTWNLSFDFVTLYNVRQIRRERLGVIAHRHGP